MSLAAGANCAKAPSQEAETSGWFFGGTVGARRHRSPALPRAGTVKLLRLGDPWELLKSVPS